MKKISQSFLKKILLAFISICMLLYGILVTRHLYSNPFSFHQIYMLFRLISYFFLGVLAFIMGVRSLHKSARGSGYSKMLLIFACVTMAVSFVLIRFVKDEPELYLLEMWMICLGSIETAFLSASKQPNS